MIALDSDGAACACCEQLHASACCLEPQAALLQIALTVSPSVHRAGRHAGVNIYAVHGSETGGQPAVEYDDVLKGMALWGPTCQPMHAACPDRRWVTIPESVDIQKPRSEFFDKLEFVTLT